ncbi:hypothetical protein BJ684DRAFT_14775 [Piptocephalis cylindrospora]|uniref:Uncharacterized protein n=1 Tax=Piptocephalis cylindrospora TaxID=1907219 RepID=A0A4P9Y830_9FUNG|nr:hypothetical protein BJ684DRAFT_14775 [Piptocephalis cylindrospora]|eukprot:RKP14942.1 hypothetical protein BJ684DRAFT_14775 [Piptocephalis cylindrospora]
MVQGIKDVGHRPAFLPSSPRPTNGIHVCHPTRSGRRKKRCTRGKGKAGRSRVVRGLSLEVYGKTDTILPTIPSNITLRPVRVWEGDVGCVWVEGGWAIRGWFSNRYSDPSRVWVKTREGEKGALGLSRSGRDGGSLYLFVATDSKILFFTASFSDTSCGGDWQGEGFLALPPLFFLFLSLRVRGWVTCCTCPEWFFAQHLSFLTLTHTYVPVYRRGVSAFLPNTTIPYLPRRQGI